MNSIEEIFKLYSNDIYRYILSMEKDKYAAEDILQDTFYKAYIGMDSYQPDNVKAWLFTIAKNCFIDHFRKKRK
ncbi:MULTISPECIES: sigma-70 family RNA polymerase sigma factor [unclassified Oceanobacillus]|uniref:sigma-70 family RNA polymerase sigma factor n=1 Tax=unclassified Oceanobacillus TaxID=2630292 RepID=UPI00300E3E45